MSQSLFRANICVRKISIDSSIQAQGTGGFMSQKWRIYGLSDSLSRHLVVIISPIVDGLICDTCLNKLFVVDLACNKGMCGL